MSNAEDEIFKERFDLIDGQPHVGCSPGGVKHEWQACDLEFVIDESIAHGRKAEIIDRSKLINESILKGRSLERERIWAKLMQHIGGQTLHADSVILLSKLESIIFGEGEK